MRENSEVRIQKSEIQKRREDIEQKIAKEAKKKKTEEKMKTEFGIQKRRRNHGFHRLHRSLIQE